MGYKSLESCVTDLEKNGQLIRIEREVDPYLEMASIQLRAYEKGAAAILFENVKGSKFRALSNLFGDVDRSRFLFRDSMEMVQNIALLKKDPALALKNPLKYLSTPKHLFNALPKKVSKRSAGMLETTIDQLPQITCWKNDGGPFVTLPIVYTEDADQPGWMKSNMGMYRIQLGGNDYIQNKEIGLHYQIHRGIGVHQSKANNKGEPLKVSIFVGGPPSLSFSAVMPLPEGMPEFAFAGMLGGKRMRYFKEDGFTVCADADFVITGEVFPHDVKPEGPFGDHLGYYSLKHDFPLMKVHKVYHKKDAIWPFTVVGRPPQEDTSFGAMIHELAGDTIQLELPGVKAVHAVDAAGVHPLLFAIGSERYTPYVKERFPAEILTQANHILGFGQMSLAKFLFIAAEEDNKDLNIFNLSLNGYEGPIDLLLSLARDHKIDLTKLSILPLAEQYLLFLNSALKKDIEIAAEYLVMGAWLAFLKSQLLLPNDKLDDLDNAEQMSDLLEFQLKRLESIQKVTKLLFNKYQLGIHFFKRGDPENFNINQKIEYNINLFDRF
jgi:4-hydroxy-3-polyprenylbenzoate decarboxylase